MTFLNRLPLAIVLLLTFLNSFASGVRGTIKAEDGTILAFASIYVKETGSGTTTNVNGYYEILLPPGRYELVFQYLGFKTEVRTINITDQYLELNITLLTQTTVLQSVTVNAGNEDPAYTIMRKAIAKANYHLNELDSYTAKVYIKGAGKLIDYPWLAKKGIEKEGIEKDRVYVSESVSEIKYTRPNKYEEKVISIHSDGKDNNTSPNQFIFGSFYMPEIVEVVTPLSPRAFSYYRFEYLGSFNDRDYVINKIKVIPRSKGDNVVDGIIYIVEDWWSIHSLDIHTTKMGVDIMARSIFAPVEDKAWLPVSHRFKIDGKILGFKFQYNYLATIKDYKIKLNPKLYVETKKIEIIDEKVDKQKAKQVEKRHTKSAKELHQKLEAGKEVTRKELNKIMKEYEKEENKKQPDPAVLSEYSFKVDSGAFKKDSAYWAVMRPVPLTHEEVKGYEKTDSVAQLEKKKEAGDTVKSKHKGFQPWDILIGDNYKIGKYSNFKIHLPTPAFNTVEGFNLIYQLSLGTVLQDTNKTRMLVTPKFRYAFVKKELFGNLRFELRNKNYRFRAEAGRYVQQYNNANPIWQSVNSFTTLFLEKNLMKLLERDYLDISYRRKINDFITVNTTWSWMGRRELFNISNYKLVNRNSVEGYTPNNPINNELADAGFRDHIAVIGSAGVAIQPWIKFRIRNEHRYAIRNSSPTFTLDYYKGFNNVLGGIVDFDQIEVGGGHQFDIGVRGKIDIAVRGGLFLNNKRLFFMDFKHFPGNLTPFATNDLVTGFRLLDYYKYSTSDKYVTANIQYQFRKFLITSIPLFRMTGVKERVFMNYLSTPTSGNYNEVGYAIDGIFHFLRLEGAAAFLNGKFLNYGFRIGVATNIQVNID